MKHRDPSPADYIVPLYINELNGRMLRVPAPADHKREILFIYGHHSTLERWWGLIQDLNQTYAPQETVAASCGLPRLGS